MVSVREILEVAQHKVEVDLHEVKVAHKKCGTSASGRACGTTFFLFLNLPFLVFCWFCFLLASFQIQENQFVLVEFRP